MEIKLTNGCICDNIKIDNRDADEYSCEELQKVVCRCINTLQDPRDLIDILRTFLYSNGSYKDLYTCEECGDTVSQYTYKLN